MDLLALVADRFVYPCPGGKCDCTTYSVAGVQCLIRHGQGSSRVIVYVHGNETTLSDLKKSGIVDVLAMQCNATVFAPEYPGYGDMQNEPRGLGEMCDICYADKISAVVEAIQNNGAKNISLIGRSIGCGIAMKSVTTSAAVQSAVDNITLISPFTSLSSLFPYPLQCFAQNRMDNAKMLRHVQCPLLLIHGSDDNLIPVSHSEELQKCHDNCTLHVIPSMKHTISSNIIGHFADRIRRFIHYGETTKSAVEFTDFDVFKPKQ